MTDYSPERRARNERTIALVAAGVLGVILVSGLMQSWPLGSFVIAIAVVLVVALTFWWLFASRGARPLPTDREHARWPYLSKKTMDNIKKGR